MRTNKFGESYCHTTADVEAVLDRLAVAASDINAERVEIEGDEKPVLEVRDNGSGDTVLWIEGDTFGAIEKIARECGIEVMS